MVDLLIYVIGFAFLALVAIAVYLWLNGKLGSQSPMTAMFGPRPEKRLAIVEHASVDGRRRLVLLRRDNVEHLIMTGGPVDVVIETSIGGHGAGDGASMAETMQNDGLSAAPVFGRQNRGVARAPQTIAE
jgi:hypothetical protein